MSFKHYLVDNVNEACKFESFVNKYGAKERESLQLGSFYIEVVGHFESFNNEHAFSIFKVKNNFGEAFFKLLGYASSYGDSEFNHWSQMFEVESKEKTITVWEKI